jgi:ArsR family transcriptional regulator
LTTVTSIGIHLYVTIELAGAPRRKRAPGEPCCQPVVYPDIDRAEAERMAGIAKALADPVRLTLVDVLRKHAGKVCVAELVPLFHLTQPTISHHLTVLKEAGVVGSQRDGIWAYYYLEPGALDEIAGWLTSAR